MGSFVSHLSCPRCGEQRRAGTIQTVCECGSPLLVEYDLERLAGTASKQAVAARAATMWRYREFLPVEDPRGTVSLGEGFTPLLPLPSVGQAFGLGDL